MLRKLSAAVLGTLLISGVAAAQGVAPFPSSVNESGSNLPALTDGKTYNPFGRFAAGRWQATEPASVSESMPDMTGGLDHPTMGKGATRYPAGTGTAGYPSNVSESMPEMTGDISHPTMRH